MGQVWTQLFPPPPTVTEKTLPSLAGKVFIVTGGNAGVGFELVKILYAAGGSVYIAARSPSRIDAAIQEVITNPDIVAPGILKSLILDLSDLRTVLPCVSEFLAQETRLDVLFNNAGISRASIGSRSVQGHEAHIATNCLGPSLLTKLLLPIMTLTATNSSKNSVRIVWTTSSIMDMLGPPGGLSLTEIKAGGSKKDIAWNYSTSKAGDWFLASEFSKRIGEKGIVSITQSPGTLKTKGWDDVPWVMRLAVKPFMYEPKMGSYTELWAGFSEEVTVKDGGKMALPWGRWHRNPRKDVLESLRGVEEGGTGLAGEFWDWCEEVTQEFAVIGK